MQRIIFSVQPYEKKVNRVRCDDEDSDTTFVLENKKNLEICNSDKHECL